jgi:2-methylcitrate dehydratase PrpD
MTPLQTRSRRTATERLAAFCTELRPEKLPEHVRDDARWRTMDTLGVALAGSRMDFSDSVRHVFRTMAGAPEATALGMSDRLPAPHAAFVNAAAAHGPDYDDTHSVAMVHIGCLVVPAALAMAERTGASGAQTLTALVAGAEVGLRIGAAAPHRFHMRGYHATGVVGPFAAAAVAGSLLHLDADRLADAFGLAGSQAAGLLVGLHDGSWVKRLHPAWSVQAGLTAALLAERRFLGPRQVLESPWGLYGVLLHGDPEPVDAEAVVADLGERWLLPATTYKPYSSGAWNHSSMDAVRSILAQTGLDHRDIARIEVRVPAECIPVVCEPREAKIHPATPYHMKFSLPYSVAILAVRGHADIDDYSEEVLADAEIRDLAARIECAADPSLSPEGFPARVVVHTRDARRFEHSVAAQRGGPGNPMTPDDHRAKFRANAEPSLGAARRAQLMDAVEGAWELDRVDRLARLLISG